MKYVKYNICYANTTYNMVSAKYEYNDALILMFLFVVCGLIGVYMFCSLCGVVACVGYYTRDKILTDNSIPEALVFVCHVNGNVGINIQNIKSQNFDKS